MRPSKQPAPAAINKQVTDRLLIRDTLTQGLPRLGRALPLAVTGGCQPWSRWQLPAMRELQTTAKRPASKYVAGMYPSQLRYAGQGPGDACQRKSTVPPAGSYHAPVRRRAHLLGLRWHCCPAAPFTQLLPPGSLTLALQIFCRHRTRHARAS